MAKRKSAPLFEVKPGDWVLMGGSSASLPGDWFFAKVLLVDGDEIATAHTAQSQGTIRQFSPIESIRAVGTWEELRAIQDAARSEVRALAEKVRETENALHAAREAVWQRVREMAQHNIKINPSMPEGPAPSRFMQEEGAQP